ncbi:hypothetical protein LR090_01225 [Candidatus Bipolaricaulota bacterium]|nr:hypothetical protein [Candidatus Bipolaricaulota bacterium]
MRLRLILVVVLVHLVVQAAPVHYSLELVFSEGWELTGEALVSGAAPERAEEFVFRLYPCALVPDALVIREVNAGLEWDQVHPTAFTVPAPEGRGQTFSLSISFRGKVPELSFSEGYGIFAHSPMAAVFSQAYPLLAPWYEGAWLVQPIFPWGDAVVAEVADYSAQVSLPPGWELVATGEERQTAPQTFLVKGENLRELAGVALRGHERLVSWVDGVQVNGYFLPQHEEAGQAGLEVTAQALQLYSKLFGPGGKRPGGRALAGRGVGHLHLRVVLRGSWQTRGDAGLLAGLLPSRQGQKPHSHRGLPPVGVPGRGRLWGGIVYSGGALFFHELRTRMGDEAFFRALRRYLAEYRWRIARGQDLLSILSEESPQPLADLIQEWLGADYLTKIALASAPVMPHKSLLPKG